MGMEVQFLMDMTMHIFITQTECGGMESRKKHYVLKLAKYSLFK